MILIILGVLFIMVGIDILKARVSEVFIIYPLSGLSTHYDPQLSSLRLYARAIKIHYLSQIKSHSKSNVSWPTVHPSFVVYIRTYGGLCADGPCGGETIIDKTGRIFGRRFWNQEGAVVGTLDEKTMTELTQHIGNTDLDKIAGSPHVGTCNSAVDGVDEEWIFQTSMGNKTIDTCKNNFKILSTDLFQYVNDALRKATAKN